MRFFAEKVETKFIHFNKYNTYTYIRVENNNLSIVQFKRRVFTHNIIRNFSSM